MRKTLSVKWLYSVNACLSAIAAFEAQSQRNTTKIIDLLIKSDKLDWCRWLLPRLMTSKQQVQYAIFAARQVLNIFESEYPNDRRPRKAIEAAERCVAKGFRRIHVDAAHCAAHAADAAHAAADAARYACSAAHAADRGMELKILAYGRKLLKS